MINGLKRYSDDVRPLSLFTDDEIAAALRTVINHMVTSVFNLTPQESRWVQKKLYIATREVFVGTPNTVPIAVLQELNTKYYSHSLLNKTDGKFVVSPTPQKADVLAWVNIFMDWAKTSYDLKTADEVKLYLEFMDVLSQLGIRDTESRAAAYLPNPVKNNLE